MTAERTVAQGRLSQLVSQFEAAAEAVSQGNLARLVVGAAPVTTVEPLAAFAATQEDTFYWEQPAAGLALVGIHPALTLTGGPDMLSPAMAPAGEQWRALAEAAEIRSDALSPTPGPLSMGGFRFDPGRPPDATWSSFAGDAWVVPSVVVGRRAGRGWVQLQALVSPGAPAPDLARAIGDRAEALLERAADPSLANPARQEAPAQDLTTTEDPSTEWWRRTITDVLGAIERKELSKLVLARRIQVQASTPFAIATILDHLRNEHPAATTFAIRRGATCFLGASPEQLISLQDGVVRTAAVAGTAAHTNGTGATFEHDPKERREHAYVVDAIRDALAPLCRDLCIAETPQVLDLPTLRHLTTPIEGVLRTPVSLLELTARLHPTPAVGGVPRLEATAQLRTYEPFDRGWYAGPVGWMDGRGEGEMVVALRSALVKGNHATLFGGCGLVDGSDADREWAEAQLKMETMLRALRG